MVIEKEKKNMKRLLSLLFLLIVLVLLIMGCGGEITKHTTTETLNQTSTQTEIITETQKQTIIQTETLTEKQTETITVTTTVYISSSPTTTTSPTTTPPPTTTTPPTNDEPAIFTTSDLTLIPKLPVEGAFFKVSVTVTNTGSSQGSYDVVLYINGIDIQDNDAIISTETFTKSVSLAAEESAMVTFDKIILPSGYFTLVIDELEEFLESGS